MVSFLPGGASTASFAAESAAPRTITIPNFWDPGRRVERPPAGSVQAIRFVTADDFPPFNFLDADGHLTGFNVDLARAICAELAIRCTIQARDWVDILPAASRKIRRRGDRRDRDHRRQPRGRSISRTSICVRSGASSSAATGRRWTCRRQGLKGKTLGVVEHTAHEAYLAAFFPEVGRKIYPTPDAAREALKSGEVDASFGDGMQLSFWLTSENAANCCAFAGGPYLESRFFGEGMAIAVPARRERSSPGDQRRA